MVYYKGIVIKTGFGIRRGKSLEQNRAQKQTNTVKKVNLLLTKAPKSFQWGNLIIVLEQDSYVEKNKLQLLVLIICKKVKTGS